MYIILENERPILEFKTRRQAYNYLHILKCCHCEYWGIDSDTSFLKVKYIKGDK